MHFSHHRSIIKLLGVKVVQSGALPPALPLYIFVGALTVSVQGDGERSMLCWGNLNVAGPDLHQRRKKNILVSELQHSARARSETTACSPVWCFYSLQYIHLKSASSSSNLKTIRGENSERRTFHEWNTKSLWAQAQPSASLEGMALIWAPRVLTEKPFSTSLPLSVTCTHQDKPSGGQYKLEMSLPFRSGQQRTRTYLVVFYWEERSKTFGRALPPVCLGQQTRSYTKSRHEKTLSMKQSPLNSPLTEAEICLNSGKSISRWVRNTSSTGSLVVPLEKIYGEIRKIIFTFAKCRIYNTIQYCWLKRWILLPWQSRWWRRRAAEPCGCSRRWRQIWRGLFSVPPVYSVAAADRRTSHQRARLQLSHWVQWRGGTGGENRLNSSKFKLTWEGRFIPCCSKPGSDVV